MSITRMQLPVSGFVLAGGKSSRMGMDKATMPFGGVSLVQLALGKLRPICSHVAIVGNRPELASFAEVVPDAATGIGPLGGIAAALRHATEHWLLLLAVDMPLLPAGLLSAWAADVLHDQVSPAAACFRADGRLQPLVSLLRRELEPFVSAAVAAGERKAMPVLQQAAAMAASTGGLGSESLRVDDLDNGKTPFWTGSWEPDAFERETRDRWFANSNTPDEFRRLEQAILHRGRQPAAPDALISPGLPA